MSLPEILLWIQLQKRPGGYKFRKQVPQHPLTLDFACLRARLVIEVDGEAHDRGNQPARDEGRDALMWERGFRTVRIPAREILSNMDDVIAHLVALCDEGGPPPPPLRGGPPPRAGEDQERRRPNLNPPGNGEGAQPAKPDGGGGPLQSPHKGGQQ